MKIRSQTTLIVLSLCAAALTATAHKGATGIIKQRMDAMSEMGDAMKAIGDMVKDKTAYDLNTVHLSVKQLSRHTVEIPQQFPDTPESKNFDMSEALPEVWVSKDRFDDLAAQLKTRIDELKVVADAELDKPSLRLAFVSVTKSCSACHDDYRKPKD